MKITEKCIFRTATIVLKEDTHFMTLNKEGFNKVFSMYKAKILDE